MSEELCLPVTTQPQRRIYRCGHCRQEGHNRSTCPDLVDQRRLASERRQLARAEKEKEETEKYKLINFEITNPTQHVMLVFWSNELDKNTGESRYRYLTSLPSYAETVLRFSRRHKFITIPITEFISPPSELNEILQTPITQTIFNDQKVTDLIAVFQSTYGEDVPPVIVINDVKDYKPPKTELNMWKEVAFKSLYLLTELKRMGASNNENLEPMIDMIEDISLPPHTEMDKELAGIPSTFTNIT